MEEDKYKFVSPFAHLNGIYVHYCSGIYSDMSFRPGNWEIAVYRLQQKKLGLELKIDEVNIPVDRILFDKKQWKKMCSQGPK